MAKKHPDKAMEIPTPGIEFHWALDARESGFVFDAAKEKAVKGIQRIRMQLMELKDYDPQPQTFHTHTGTVGMYDNKTKPQIEQQLRTWLAYYEKIRDFCLMAQSVVMHMEAERFGQEMKRYYESQKGAA